MKQKVTMDNEKKQTFILKVDLGKKVYLVGNFNNWDTAKNRLTYN